MTELIETHVQTPAGMWTPYDYVSPGLRVVRPDACFPHMRPGDPLRHPWKYLRRDVPHVWYADERFPLMGFLNRDEAVLLHNLALQFAGRRALEIGSWLGWSTCHLALAGVQLDVLDPAHDDPVIRASVEDSLARCGVTDRVRLVRGRSPEGIAAIGGKWSLFFIDGDHESAAPLRDTIAALPHAMEDCGFVFHDLASPDVAAALRFLQSKGFHVVVYQTAQVMGFAWRGDVAPVAHVPDPNVAWQIPAHLAGLPIAGFDFTPPAASSYRQLRDVRYTDASSRPSVCIVTSEMIGPFKNGGVGTAMTGLAELLAAGGLPVTVLYTGTVWAPDVRLDPWKQHYAARGIELAALSLDQMKTIAGPVADCGFGVPWLVFEWLRNRSFDVIHFNDCCGEGSLALAAKRTGLAFRDSLLVVALHSPSRWVFDLNQILPSNRLMAAFDFAERVSVSCADLLWSPSRYQLDWATSQRFVLPQQTFVQQYVIPPPAGGADPAPHGRVSPPRNIVFFGRLEERKGLRLFCNAIDALRAELAERGISVTFLGKPEKCAGMPSLEYIAKRSAAWQFPVHTLTTLGQPDALRVLREGDSLAVMASPFDNSPCTVYEALAAGIPFLATRAGGIPELVAKEDREHVLFDHSTEGLRGALHDALANGRWIAGPAISQDENRASWKAMHEHWKTFLPDAGHAERAPGAVAVIIDHPPGAPLGATLQSLAPSAKVHRVVILNRGEVMEPPNIDLVAADAEAIEAELAGIVEEHVLLLHSGVRVDANRLEAMLAALQHSGADGLIPAAQRPGRLRTRILPPLGGSAAFSLIEGVTFTGAMLVRRDVLTRARAGRPLATASPFLGLADYCVTRSRQILPYPEPVIELPEGMVIRPASSVPARVAAFDEAPASDRYYMLAAAYASAPAESRFLLLRRLASAAADFGLTFLVRAGAWVSRRIRR